MNAAGLIFSNIHDQSVPQLTHNRTMASVPFGCRYRLIDFALSNMVNSDITKVGIITHNNYLTVAQQGEGRIAQTSRLLGEQWDVIQNAKRPKEVAVDLIYSTEEYEVREEKAGAVNTYISEEIKYFVTGEKDPKDDATWQKFIKTLDSLGRKELMEICQSAYDRQQK